MAGDKGHRQNKLWEPFGQNGHNGQVVGKDGVLEQNDQGMVTWKCANQLQTGHRVDGRKRFTGNANSQRVPNCAKQQKTGLRVDGNAKTAKVDGTVNADGNGEPSTAD